MIRPQLILAPGKEKSLLRRHPWLFSGAVRRTVGNPANGDLVDVMDASGRWMAVGHYQNDSIICKVLSFETQNIDDTFFERRLTSAIAYRKRLGFFNDDETNVFRLVNGEGDFMPGLICDWYAGTLVMQAHSEGMHQLFPLFTRLFVQLLSDYGLASVFDKSSATLSTPSSDGFLWGREEAESIISAHGNRMYINFFEGQKTGFFVDQRENRHLLSSLAQGRRVLNCFGYTGGFSLAALHGGAEYVETVDISRKAIDLCNRNVELNFGDCQRHKGVVADVLQYIQTLKNTDDKRFDLIVLDPPAFAKNHRSLQQGLKGYRAINQRALESIAEGGLLLTFSCSQAVSKDDFQTMLFTASANAGRKVRIVKQLPHAIDHPVSIYHPEGEYLKGLLVYVE